MTDDSIAAELAAINNQLTAADVALGNVYRRYGVDESEILVIRADDVEAHAAIAGIRSAHAQLDSFLARLPEYD